MTLNCQALFYEKIKCAWEHADSKNTSLPGTFYGHFESAWESADEKNFFFARQFLYGNIESVWDSADATNTFFQALFMGKVLRTEAKTSLCPLHLFTIFVTFGEII